MRLRAADTRQQPRTACSARHWAANATPNAPGACDLQCTAHGTAGRDAHLVCVCTPGHAELGLEPHRYDYVSALEGCAAFNRTQSLKFFMGHTHCNDVHPHGRVGAGFRVAGQGMEGCGNYGVPVLDTTEQRIRIWCAGGRLR